MPNEHRQNYVLFATCRFPDDHQVAVLGRHGPTPGRRAAPRVGLGVTHHGGPKQAVYSPPTSPPYPRKWAKSGQNGPKHRDPLSRAPNWGQAPKNASNGRPQVHQGHLQRTRSYVYLKMRLLSHTPLSQNTDPDATRWRRSGTPARRPGPTRAVPRPPAYPTRQRRASAASAGQTCRRGPSNCRIWGKSGPRASRSAPSWASSTDTVPVGAPRHHQTSPKYPCPRLSSPHPASGAEIPWMGTSRPLRRLIL